MRPARFQPLRVLQQARSGPLRHTGGLCSRCLPRGLGARRWNSSEASSPKLDSEKPYYICTPIFYVNAAPHIGHLYTMVLTDVMKRWQQLNGKQAFLCTGTDEHGMKIQRAAAKEGMPPKEFCDNNSAKFKDLAALANISNDFFIRTTDQEHKDAVAHFWLGLKRGLSNNLGLYKGTHAGWYCVSDECFYPEDMVQPGIVPQTGKKITVNTETENEVEWIEEDTWFFPLKSYKTALLEFYDANPDWIKPAHRMNEVRDWVENHLEDLSVTRPASRLSWGIPDPEDDNQTIYVWVDALINYLTKSGYGSTWHSAGDNQGLWPADMHVIGKDILRFHAIYWPAMLMALGLPLPKQILCHNHWTMSDRKMSKSLGNVVSPTFAIQRWDVDPLRYFLMRNGSFAKDMNYSNELIETVYMKDLQANIGNLFSRVARPRMIRGKWSVEEAVDAYFNKGLESAVGPDGPTGKYVTLIPYITEAPALFRQEMDNFDPGAAIRVTHNLLRMANRYITDTEPWKLAQELPSTSRARLNWVIFHTSEALRISGILLQPIMPTKASRLLDDLGVKEDRRTIEFAALGADENYGVVPPLEATTRRLEKWETLFPPIPSVDLSDQPLAKKVDKMLYPLTKNKVYQMTELLAMEAKLGEDSVAAMLAKEKPIRSRKRR